MLTSVPTTPAAENDKLEMLSINIKHWRKEKGLGFRFMPAHMWDEAVVLAWLLGDRRVSCATGLNFEELKRRMQGRQGQGAHTPDTAATDKVDSPQFIELPGVAVTPPAPPQARENTEHSRAVESAERPAATQCAAPSVQTTSASEAIVEVTAANGDRLTVRMPVATFNISSLIHDFRQARP